MEELASLSVEEGAFPADWNDEAREASIVDGVLHCGEKCRPSMILPAPCTRLCVEIQVECGPASVVEFGNGRTELSLDFRHGRHRVLTHGAATLATHHQPIAPGEGVRSIVFSFDKGRWQAFVDDVLLLTYDSPHTSLPPRISFAFWGNCLVHSARICGERLEHVAPPRPRQDFHLEVTVDFPDDLYYAPYTLDMVDELFAEYARWGVRRCHWIYDGKQADHWWNYFPEPLYSHYLQTLENFGGDILDTAVAASHRHGIELYGIFKPFEMAYMLNTYGKGTKEARRYGRFSHLGGVIYRCPDFTIGHRELMTQRKPSACGQPAHEAFTRIDIVADSDAPAAFEPGGIRLFVSEDNVAYRPYDGPLEIVDVVEDYPLYTHTGSGGNATETRRRSRVIRLRGLNLRESFFALVAPGAAGTFGNSMVNLIHVFGERGEEHRITLGIVPRAGKIAYDISTATTSDSDGLDFCRRGIEFDNIEGTPSACLTGYDAMREWHAFDGGHGFLGIARGKEKTAVGVLSPSFPKTRQWWLQWVQDILDAGADGVDIRTRNHHTHMAWGEFGFERPVRDAFLARHGVDIWETDHFDRSAWQVLRGEAYTQFFREAKQLVQAHGKPLSLHISRTMDSAVDQLAAMGIHFDWRTWLREGLANSVTMKEVWPQTPLAEEVRALAEPRNIPLIFSPFANTLWRRPGGVTHCEKRIRGARDGGFSGFQFYESCAVIRAHPDGHLTMQQPALRELFQREFER